MKRLLWATAALMAVAGGALAQTAPLDPAAMPIAPAPSPAPTVAPDPTGGAPTSAPIPQAAPPAAMPAPVAPVVDPNVYQVLRTGDRELSCAQLGAEANTLNAQLMAEQQEQARQAQRAKQGRGLAGGVAGGVLGGAARFGLARGMVGGALGPFAAQALTAVADSSSQAVGQAIANGGDAPVATVSPQQQRMNHLLVLYREKGC